MFAPFAKEERLGVLFNFYNEQSAAYQNSMIDSLNITKYTGISDLDL